MEEEEIAMTQETAKCEKFTPHEPDIQSEMKRLSDRVDNIQALATHIRARFTTVLRESQPDAMKPIEKGQLLITPLGGEIRGISNILDNTITCLQDIFDRCEL